MDLFLCVRGRAGQCVTEPISVAEPRHLVLSFVSSAQMGNEVQKVLSLPWGHRAAEPGTEPRPASFHPGPRGHWSGGILFLGVSWGHLARMTKCLQELLLLPCHGREVALNLLMKMGCENGYRVGSYGRAHPGGRSLSSCLTFC